MRHLLAPALALVLFMGVGCGNDQAGPDPSGSGQEGGGHAHGGERAEIEGTDAHLEIRLEHDRGVMIVHVQETDGSPSPIPAPLKAEVEADGKKKVLEGLSLDATDEGASEWHFRDPLLKGEVAGAVFTLTFGGSERTAIFTHDHDHSHAHDDEG